MPREGRLKDPVGDSAADGLNVGGGLAGDNQRGEVCVIGEGNAGQAKLARPHARIPHRPGRRVTRPLRVDVLVSGERHGITLRITQWFLPLLRT